MFATNVKKAPDDPRDWNVSTTVKEVSIKSLPKTFDYRKDLLPVRNQGRQGSCFAFSIAAMKQWQEFKEHGLQEYFSPQFFYDNRSNAYDNNPDNDEGMTSRDAMKLLKTIGICFEADYPYNYAKKTRDEIPPEIYEKAKNFTIRSYARIYSIDDLKKSLFINGPCIITVPVYSYTHQMWKPQHKGQSHNGGHAMCVVGYNKEGFILRNSWGRSWNEDGHCIFPYDDWGYFWEIWTTIDGPSNPVPPPSRFCCR